MTDAEWKFAAEELLDAGTALAHRIGHNVGCPKVSPAVPCTCGCSREQAKALDDWLHLAARVK